MAINKVRDEDNRCRVCGTRSAVQCAHITGRVADNKAPLGGLHLGWTDGDPVKVWPTRIVPLCQPHHNEYDAHRLDLLPHLNVAEVLQAVADCAVGKSNGLEAARQRLTGEKVALSTAD